MLALASSVAGGRAGRISALSCSPEARPTESRESGDLIVPPSKDRHHPENLCVFDEVGWFRDDSQTFGRLVIAGVRRVELARPLVSEDPDESIVLRIDPGSARPHASAAW